ncbi:MAG: PepSY domain-containing protein [Luteitalea sp.]|nr:PepSY domain-containing protein [Luteitalea sp.]
MSLRQALVRVHRWVGLAIALFLVVAGLTGSVIAFNHELDEWLNPDLFRVQSRGAPISSLDLAARVEAAEPRLRVTYVPLHVEDGHALVLGVAGRGDPTSGTPDDLGYDEVFLNPITGARLGERKWGSCCFERKQLIPFLYSVHYSLHLPEVWGLWVMGTIALVWMLDCFVGFYLTLPRRKGRGARGEVPGGSEGRGAQGTKSDSRPSFWRRWKPAWKVKLGARPYRVNFDLHRAGGLWFWGLLFTVAVSGVYLTLQFEVFRPVLSLVMPITPSPFEELRPAPETAGDDPAVSFTTIVATATQEAARRGWQPPFDAFYSPEFGVYGVGFGDHHAPGTGVPFLYFDQHSGRVLGQTVPGEGTAGDVFMQWMFPLHSGQIIGLPGRIVISITGLVVALLSATGVVIWAKKRRGRRAISMRAPRVEAVPTLGVASSFSASRGEQSAPAAHSIRSAMTGSTRVARRAGR